MQTPALAPPGKFSQLNWPRGIVVTLTLLAIFIPLTLIFFQSFLSAPFFAPIKEFTFNSYRFIFDDSDFCDAFWNGLVLATGLAVIAVPLGALLAFLMTRTDLPGRSCLVPMLLVPIFFSPLVMAFGYVV